CPRCGMQLSAPEECAGRSTKCRGCGQTVTVPWPAAAAPAQVPVAKQPPPTKTKSYRKVIIAAIPATIAVAFLFGSCAASVVFWMFPRVQGEFQEGIKSAVNEATGQPKDDMTFQELEDRLNASGLSVNRVMSQKSAGSMWFGLDRFFDGKSAGVSHKN